MPFGQLVIGAPGSGKTTYCNGALQFLKSVGRDTVIVNLDPGNDVLPYDCAVDVMELISLEDAMEELGLGPNGGLVYCMEYLEKNLDWLEEKISAECAGKYVLFDCPGQVELFTHHHSMRNIAEKLSAWGWQVCCVHLVDSHHCSDDSKFLSTALVALSAMTMLEMPHVNVLSKMDLVQCMGRLHFDLSFYTRSDNLSKIPEILRLKHDEEPELPAQRRSDTGAGDGAGAGAAGGGRQRVARGFVDNPLRRLQGAIAELIDDFQLVHFIPLGIHDRDTLAYLLRTIDKANGFLFAGATSGVVPGDTLGLGRDVDYDDIMDLMEERYLFDPDDPYDDRSSDEDLIAPDGVERQDPAPDSME